MPALRLALSFLTRLPVGTLPDPLPPGAMARATALFPATGAVIGGIAWVGTVAGAVVWDGQVAAVIGVGLWALVTGGLHLDGLADCLDGWLCNGDAERRRAVMHDPRIGALSAGLLCLFLLLKVALLRLCLERGALLPAMWCAPILARAPLALELRAPAATPDRGLFAAVSSGIGPAHGAASLALAAALLSPLLLDPAARPQLLAAALAAAAFTPLWIARWRRLIGGLNGDTLGAAVEIRETIALAFLAMAPPLR